MKYYCVMFNVIAWHEVDCNPAFDMHMVQGANLSEALAQARKDASGWGAEIEVLGILESSAPISEAVWYDTVSTPLTI